jgi:hypothetical protein
MNVRKANFYSEKTPKNGQDLKIVRSNVRGKVQSQVRTVVAIRHAVIPIARNS